MKKGRPPSWEPEAVEYLENLAGTAPIQILIDRFNRRAKLRGWSKRTATAITVKLKRLQISQKATEDGWCMAQLASLLGIHRDRVRLWTRNGLKSKKVTGNIRSIFGKDLKVFAKEHPGYLRGIERDRLMYVLQDERLCDRIVAMGNPTQGYAFKVQRMDTKQIYASVKAAARDCFITPGCIRDEIKNNRPAGGILFRLVEISAPKRSERQIIKR